MPNRYGAERNLKQIIALVNAPNWTPYQKRRIRELAQAALKDVQYYKRLNPTIADLDDEVGGPVED